MTDEQDILSKASRALRERRDGHHTGSGFTRARVLNTLRQRRSKRTIWWRAGLPTGVLLLGTSAWAQATGQWPAVWHTVVSALSLPVTSEGQAQSEIAKAVRSKPASARKAISPSATALSGTDNQRLNPPDAQRASEADSSSAPAAGRVSNSSQPSPVAEPTSDESRRGSTLPVRRVSAARQVTSSDAEAGGALQTPPVAGTAVAADPSVAAFRNASDAHLKRGQLSEALSAYRSYLTLYPGGQFVPEARYNVGIVLLKLGRLDEAREALLPFAEGRYGSARRQSAQRLVDALSK